MISHDVCLDSQVMWVDFRRHIHEVELRCTTVTVRTWHFLLGNHGVFFLKCVCTVYLWKYVSMHVCVFPV